MDFLKATKSRQTERIKMYRENILTERPHQRAIIMITTSLSLTFIKNSETVFRDDVHGGGVSLPNRGTQNWKSKFLFVLSGNIVF